MKDARGFGATGISVPHRSEVESLVGDAAARLEEARFVKTRGGDKKDVALRKAATLRLELGDFRAYCELMKEIRRVGRGAVDRARGVLGVLETTRG